MGAHERKSGRFDVTILFCDIRGFTALFDNRDPEEALAFANSVLGELGAVVEACAGEIDKFTGDGFLAYFGINSSTEVNHAEVACWCAIRLRAALMVINSTRYGFDQPVVSIGMGIHSGPVAAGTISTLNKKEFTVLGSTVNLASRIESLTKFFGVDCLISEETSKRVQDKFVLKEMPPQRLRGVSETATTHWLSPLNIWP
ncbi:MAG: adenylate/guanylate cyclase domain-containing protein [Bdellovibrio sp.]|nr:adenylate/guanylate cyclase domain-containing protein [Bdellovibrio sp.]